MSLPVRTAIVSLPKEIGSTYGKVPAGALCREAADALVLLDIAIRQRGGVLKVTDSDRSTEAQQAARERYDRWVADGKPNPNVPGSGFDPSKHKADVAALPGRSWHNAGRAVDLFIVSGRTSRTPRSVVFPDQPMDKQLDLLWPLAKTIGWSPIIKTPDERASESWHFDFFGVWAHVRARLGYSDAAMAACLDVGRGGYGADLDRWKQAQLHRAGYDVGSIDGILGTKSKGGAKAAGVDLDNLTGLQSLPSANTYSWPM